MEKELEKLMNCISKSEAEEFIDSFEAFGESAVSDDEQEHILSSVMRKAGFEMKDNITAAKTRKRRRRIVTLIAAAVLLSLGAVGAGAYYEGYRLEDGQIIRKFGGDNAEEWLDSKGLNEIQNEQNGHFDISMYSFISDGNYCQAVWCVEALDDAAVKQMDNINPASVQAYYADTGEKINMGGTTGWTDVSLNDANHFYFAHKMPLKDVDISRDIEFQLIPGEVYISGAVNLADGLKFTVSASPNVETKTIANENGIELLLSPLGASQKFRDGEGYPYIDPETYSKLWLVKKDGQLAEFNGAWGCSTAIDGDTSNSEFPIMWSVDFYDITDISDVSGIKLNDYVFMEVDE